MSPRDDSGADRPKRPAPGKLPVVGVEKVTCACGHEAELPLYEDRKDKFRDARRKALVSRVCPACRQKAHAELTAREQAAAAERKKARGGPTPRKEKAARPVVERLPDGSEFHVTYDATAERWSGALTVTTPEGGKVFEGEAGGVFTLLTALDRQYRDWLAAQAAPGEAGGGAAGGS